MERQQSFPEAPSNELLLGTGPLGAWSLDSLEPQLQSGDQLLDLIERWTPLTYSRITHGTLERVALSRLAVQASTLDLLEDDRIAPKYRKNIESLSLGILQFHAYYPTHFANAFLRSMKEPVISESRTFSSISVTNGLCDPLCEMEMLSRHRGEFRWREFSLNVARSLVSEHENAAASIPKMIVADEALRRRFLELANDVDVCVVANNQTLERVGRVLGGIRAIQLPEIARAASAIDAFWSLAAQIRGELRHRPKSLFLLEAGPLPTVLMNGGLCGYPDNESIMLDFGRALPLLDGQLQGTERWINRDGSIRNPWRKHPHPRGCWWSAHFTS